jgi:WhiB family transcriptional regulator, redox-sensing transcriptional regulator
MDTDLWFPVSQRPRLSTPGVRRALEICMSCPVRMECLAYAVRAGERGIWGGMTEEERRDSRLCRRLRAGALASWGDDLMPMQRQPDGVHRARRGTDRPPREYDIIVDGEIAGHVERLDPARPASPWRVYRDGEWPRKFEGSGAYLEAVRWLAAVHRAAKQTAEPVTAAEGASVQVLAPVVSDPFSGDPFADPLAP